MFNISKEKIIIPVIISGLAFSNIVCLVSFSNKITALRYEIKQYQTQIKQCQETNQQLTSQLQIQQEEYEKAQRELHEASIKPVKKVYIKQTIKEPVYITNDDCQKMVDLINQTQEQLK
jgi:uncharacterized membrane protein (DUF106 family)